VTSRSGGTCEKSATDKHNRQAHRIPFKNSYFRGLRMMLSRICRLTAAAVLLSLTVVPVAGASQQTPPRGWWRNEAIVKELGLAVDQVTRINTIFETTMPELRQDREELERLEAKLSRMIQDDRMDEATLSRHIDRVETARANGNKTRSMMLTRMYRVLTREQRVRFDQLSKQWTASAGGRGASPTFPPPAPAPGPSTPNQGSNQGPPQANPAPSDSPRRPG
jgi:Spy/CpxP family protein refolding chaperone